MGSLSHEIQKHIFILNQLTNELMEVKDPICSANKKSKKFDYLWHVLNKFYLTRIQKRQAELLSMSSDIMLEIEQWHNIFSDNIHFSQWYEPHFKFSAKANLNQSLKATD